MPSRHQYDRARHRSGNLQQAIVSHFAPTMTKRLNQVRSMAEVATAVTEGDLTRQVSMEASGEVAALKDTINEMIRNLKDTTQKNMEQDWLKPNLARFTRMLQGQWGRRFHFRTAKEWRQCLADMGFDVEIAPMRAGTPFANIVVYARRT